MRFLFDIPLDQYDVSEIRFYYFKLTNSTGRTDNTSLDNSEF